MGQIEELVEYWVKSNNLPFGYEGVEWLIKKLQGYIEVCSTLPNRDKIKALSFLYDKCDYILNKIASSMNYQLEYEPSDDEVWDFIEQERKNIDVKSEDLPYWKYVISEDNIECIELIDESVLYEYVIDPMRKKYKEKNKYASECCDKINDIQTNIYIEISKEKERQAFLNEVFSSDNKTVKTTIDECLVNCNIKEIKPKLSHLLRGAKGNSVAIVIKALERLEYTTENAATLHRIFKNEFGVEGEYNGITSGNRLIEKYIKFGDKKGEELFRKMEIAMKELEQ